MLKTLTLFCALTVLNVGNHGIKHIDNLDYKVKKYRKHFIIDGVEVDEDYFDTHDSKMNKKTSKKISKKTSKKNVVSYSKKHINKPYVYGASCKTTKCFDCSSFVRHVYKDVKHLPRTSREQYKLGKSVCRKDIKKGDLVFFYKSKKSKRVTHVGMYVGDGKFIHASSKAKKVIISSLDKYYYRTHLKGIKRLMNN
jgi:cell wall-associated NlpC family hydrolase